MSERPPRPWGPALTSASGAPPRPRKPAGGDAGVARRSAVRLPMKATGRFEVFVDGRLQAEGRDFHVVGRLLVFGRVLEAGAAAGLRQRILRRLRPRTVPAGRVDVRYELDGHRLTATGLEVDRLS